MHILEYFSQITIENEYFLDRKLICPSDTSFVLYGARGTGKSSLVIDFISGIDEDTYLYIDCQDPIFALEDIDIDSLNEFLNEEDITVLILDHYYDGFLEVKPSAKQLIIVSREKEHFDILDRRELHPLDYEEFLAFDRTSSPSISFNHFLKVGTLPISAYHSITTSSIQLRNYFYSSFDDDESRLILVLARYQGRRITINQIYTYAKEYFRISKDWTYKTIRRFVDEHLILFVKDMEGKGAKKMFLYDFALSKYLSKSQSFLVTFDSMIALALYKHGIEFKSMGSHGYVIGQNELIVASIFENEEQFWKKSYNKIHIYKKANIQKVTVVTVSNQYRYTLNDIKFEALPFYEWSIVNE